MSIPQLKRDVARANRAAAALRPVRTPGMRTNSTTRGVTQIPLTSNGQTTTTKSNGVARYA